ncbi:MAG: rhodanese-like domain-containing protein [bacterium]
MNIKSIFLGSAAASVLVVGCSSTPPASPGKPVALIKGVMSVDVVHNGKKAAISRNQDNSATVNPAFAKTSRPCPPFCIQPMVLAPGVETIAEMEIIDALSRMANGDDSLLVIDSRTPDWVAKGTIPGAVNLPWTGLNPKKGATTDGIIDIMTKQFNVKLAKGVDSFAVDDAIVAGDTSKVFDFSDAKTLVMFCNGMWCGQSPNNIMNLLKFGYPAEKIKWYRGGMQDWSLLGLSTT